jgi:hypothetical protein
LGTALVSKKKLTFINPTPILINNMANKIVNKIIGKTFLYEANIDTSSLKSALISMIDSKTDNNDYKQQLYAIPNNKLQKYLSQTLAPLPDSDLQNALNAMHLSSTPDQGVKSNGEKYDTNKITLSNEGKDYFSHLFDYCLYSSDEEPLTSEVLKDRLNKTYPLIVKDYNAWDLKLKSGSKDDLENLRRYSGAGKESAETVEIIEELPKKLVLVRLTNANACKKEGAMLGHCVQGENYFPDKQTIWSIRDNGHNIYVTGRPYVTLQLGNSSGRGGPNIGVVNGKTEASKVKGCTLLQIKGSNNGAPNESMIPIITSIINKYGLVVKGDARLIGWYELNGIGYDPKGKAWLKAFYADKSEGNKTLYDKQMEAVKNVWDRITPRIEDDPKDPYTFDEWQKWDLLHPGEVFVRSRYDSYVKAHPELLGSEKLNPLKIKELGETLVDAN